MSELCGAPHPEKSVVCDRLEHRGAGFHRSRPTGDVWEGSVLPDLRRQGKWGLAGMASRTRRPDRTPPIRPDL
ncbi:hypothetical protein ACFZAM_31765 [Streptomyces sp. NPDC008079]|uniref:hypothetical protein n=1 Tax=Streptomyces sp. NPDC008079 TaxID=3364806 RepID=UPI0036EB8A6B